MADPRLTAYMTALDAMRRGRYVVCVPGTLEGRDVVTTLSIPVDEDTIGFIAHPVRAVRAGFALGMCRAAHRRAARTGAIPLSDSDPR